MELRRAVPGDIPGIVKIYEAARASMRKLGIDQWQDGYPDGQAALRDIRAGIGWVAADGGAVIATAAVYVGHEPTYDTVYGGDWRAESQIYGIIHRIAVAPEARGKRVASAMMDLCAELSRAQNVRSLRCDTHRGNAPMRSTLEKNGYELRGVIYLSDGAERVAYEKLI